VEKKIDEGAFGKTDLRGVAGAGAVGSSSRTQGSLARAALTVATGGLPGHGGGWEVGKQREEVEGDRLPFSPRAGMARGGGSTVVGGYRRRWLGAAALGKFGREWEAVWEMGGGVRSGACYL
jgi:hypothetical protein